MAHQGALVQVVDAAQEGGVDDEPLQRDLEDEGLQLGVDAGMVVGVEDPQAGALRLGHRWGAIGDGPHALHEHVVVSELPARAALLAGLMARIGTWDN